MPDAPQRSRPPADGLPPAEAASASVAIVVLASCGVLVSLVQTMVVPLLPQFPVLMSVSPSTASWLVAANLVAGAVSAPVLGRLGDMYGKRRMLLVALGLVGGGSLLGALAPNIAVLLAARVLQGAAFGVIALGMSLMRDVLPPDRVGGGVALMSSSLGFGGAIGLPITGVVAQFASWRWLFAGAAVIGVVQILLVRRLVPESAVHGAQQSSGAAGVGAERSSAGANISAARSPGGAGIGTAKFDTVGAIGVGALLVCLLLAVSKGNEWGWTSPVVIGLFVATAVLIVVCARHLLRVRAPLVDLRVSARPAVLWTNVASILVGFAMFAGFVLATQILQAPEATGYGFGLSLIAAGVALLPMGFSMVVFSTVSARLSGRFGPRTTLVLGMALLGVGNLGFAMLPSNLGMLIAVATVAAVGAALAYSAIPLLIMRAVPESETAAANSLNTLCRQLGTSSCTAVAAAVTTASVVSVGGATLPSGFAYTAAFVAAGASALVGMVIAFLTPSATSDSAPTPDLAPAR